MSIERLLEKLKALSQTGLTYTKDPYDKIRYKELADIAVELTTSVSHLPAEEVAKIWIEEKGYATPKIDVRGAAFRGSKVLLCREKSDGKWTLPGGWADVGDSPAHSVLKEIKEETGFDVKTIKLVALWDRDKHAHPKMLTHVYKFFFLCEITGGTPTPSEETSEIDFFDIDSLPELSTPRVLKNQILRCYEHLKDMTLPTEFD